MTRQYTTLTLPSAHRIKKTAVVITPQRQAGTVPANTRELGFKGRGMAGR